MSSARYIVGDTRDVVASLPDGSVDLILTSPPFLALRSYLPADHPDKHREIGSEPNPAGFIDTLLELTAEWGRVLAPHGSIAVELGDTYSGGGGTNHLYEGSNPDAGFNGSADFGTIETPKRSKSGWPLAKSLALIPELYRVALAYGINPLTGDQSPAGRWRVRNSVTWARPNPPVGALGDKYRPSTSDMVIACRSSKRWFDLDAVRTAPSDNSHGGGTWTTQGGENANAGAITKTIAHPAGAPPLDHWIIPTHPYKGAHYATFPPELCRIPIESMCPRQVCTVCGEPRRRITGEPAPGAGGYHQANEGGTDTAGTVRTVRTVLAESWSTCGHNHWRPGVVLDPFGGSGTVGAVATGHGRDAILIDLDERNADLAAQRIGMFCTIETLKQPEKSNL